MLRTLREAGNWVISRGKRGNSVPVVKRIEERMERCCKETKKPLLMRCNIFTHTHTLGNGDVYCLYDLPERVNISYNLRSRFHDRVIPEKKGHLAEKNFVTLRVRDTASSKFWQ